MKRNELACEQAKELLEFELDGDLGEAERAALRSHLQGCEACRAWQASLRGEFALIASLPQVGEPQDFTERVMSRLPARPAPHFIWRRALAYAVACLVALAALWLAVRPGNHEIARQPTPRKGPMIVKDQPVRDNDRKAVVTPEVSPVVKASPQPATGRVALLPPTRPVRPAIVRRPSRAIRVARAAESPTDYVQLGESYESQGMLDEALAAYQQADAQSHSLGTSLAVARVQDKLGRTEEAMETYVAAAFADWSEEPTNGNTEG